MLRSSIKRAVFEAAKAGEISEDAKIKIVNILKNWNHHKRLRNELMMMIHPIRMNTSGKHQDAIIPDVINQVKSNFEKLPLFGEKNII